MYTWIRRLHLFTGLFLLVFVMMYFATGYVMIHAKWFPRGEPRKSSRVERLAYAGDRAAPEFREYVEQTFAVHGKKQPARQQADGSWRFNYTRPGVNYEVAVSAAGDQATITRTEFGAAGLANGLHRLHGFGGGRLYDAWAVIYDLASAAMILFALSGIYLWHQSTQVRWPGWVCLALSFGFSAAMMLYFLFSK